MTEVLSGRLTVRQAEFAQAYGNDTTLTLRITLRRE